MYSRIPIHAQILLLVFVIIFNIYTLLNTVVAQVLNHTHSDSNTRTCAGSFRVYCGFNISDTANLEGKLLFAKVT